MLQGSELKIVEALEAPQEFQDMVTDAGGLNPYGEPNFRIAWAQTETMWQGGHWRGNIESNEPSYTGYREVLLGDGLPHWMLLQWVDAGKSVEMPFLPAESAEVWYEQNKDPETGLSILGEYPYEGSYQLVMDLSNKYFENGKLKLVPWELNSDIIDLIIPIIEKAKELEIMVMIKAMKDEEEKNQKDKKTMFEDMYRDIRINPNLHASWLDDKQRQLERNSAKALPNNRFFQSDRPL